MSDKILSFPNSIGTTELLALLILLLKSYFTPGIAVKPALLSKVTEFLFSNLVIFETYGRSSLIDTTLLVSLSL